MGYAIGRNNSTSPIRFLVVLSSDHITGATGKTLTVTVAKGTGSFATPAGAISEVGNGIYQIAPNATDANTVGPLMVHATASGCDPMDDQFDVVNYDPFAFIPTGIQQGPNAISATTIIDYAFSIIGVKSPGESLPAHDYNFALLALNQIVAQWGLQSLTIPYVGRDVFPLEAGKGGPDDPYMIGFGGDFDVARPQSIRNVGLFISEDNGGPFELTRSLYTTDAYAAIVQKDLQSSYFSGLYYQPSFTSGFANIYLWPVPSDDSTSLVLYCNKQLDQFANLTATYDLPPGAVSALQYEVANEMAMPYHKQWNPQMQTNLLRHRAIYKRANTQMADLGMDAALTTGVGKYDILTDQLS